MVDQILSFLFGSKHERDIRKIKPLVDVINSHEPAVKKLTNEEIRAKTTEFRSRIEKGEPLDSLLPEAFALVREASVRTLGLRHFDVQMMGGIVLHQGRISEMKTGEGKRSSRQASGIFKRADREGRPCRDGQRLSARCDAEWMSPVYRFLGLTVGTIQHDMDHMERQAAYACDITYGTNNEFDSITFATTWWSIKVLWCSLS